MLFKQQRSPRPAPQSVETPTQQQQQHSEEEKELGFLPWASEGNSRTAPVGAPSPALCLATNLGGTGTFGLARGFTQVTGVAGEGAPGRFTMTSPGIADRGTSTETLLAAGTGALPAIRATNRIAAQGAIIAQPLCLCPRRSIARARGASPNKKSPVNLLWRLVQHSNSLLFPKTAKRAFVFSVAVHSHLFSAPRRLRLLPDKVRQNGMGLRGSAANGARARTRASAEWMRGGEAQAWGNLPPPLQ